MVLPVAHQDVAVGHHGHALQPLELAVTGAPTAESSEEGAVRMEDLDAVVAGVTDEYVALVVNGYAPARKGDGSSVGVSAKMSSSSTNKRLK
jgi:hypothetical protein